jgi:hypothetical protein
VSDLRVLLNAAADTVPAGPTGRADRAIARARRLRRTRVVAVAAAAVAAVVAGALAVPVASWIGTLEPEPVSPGDETGLPEQVYAVPLHSPTVGVGDPLGQPAAYLLGGVSRADGWVGRSCCHLAVVGAANDTYAFLELPGLVEATEDNTLQVRLSPDGRTVAFPAEQGVGLLDLVEGTSSVLEAPTNLQVSSVLDWSDDGSRLAVAADDDAGNRLVVATVTLADQPEWSRPEIDPASDGSLPAAALSPDGGQIAFAQDGAVQVAPSDAGAARVVLTAPFRGEVRLAWSRDGEKIVVTWRDPRTVGRFAGRDTGIQVELDTGYAEDIEDRNYLFEGPLLGFSGTEHLLLINRDAGTSGPRTVDRLRLADNGLTDVTLLPDDVDPALIDVALSLDGTPREAAQPADPTRWAWAIAGGSALIALAVVFTIGYRRHRR